MINALQYMEMSLANTLRLNLNKSPGLVGSFFVGVLVCLFILSFV